MTGFRFLRAVSLLVSATSLAQAGEEAVSRHLRDPSELAAPSFEMAAETSYLWGSLANPNSYEIGAQFLTARWRWGTIERAGFMHGYNQVYFLGMAEPIFRGPESFYYGISVGLRYNFVQPGSHFQPYLSGGVGLGWIDSHSDVFGAQGQDFTFNILSAAGVSYQVNDHLKVSAGVLYQHLSNGGQTDPNPSLNLFGPQLGLTYSF
ncbi:MAG TPA: acyloxyacyl hydrolase [Chthoniobacterales bacterium]|nr:acyloxyacyl hydrolase [Chthoniobacterales bacterium]